MNRRINWDETSRNWKPSKGSEKVTHEDEIKKMIKSFEYCSELGERGLIIGGNQNRTRIYNDELNKYEILGILSQQLKKHKCLYKILMNGLLAYELPFYCQSKDELRYAKVLYEEGNVEQPKRVTLFYHLDRKDNEVYYE